MRFGSVALIGRTNVGKSTLLNALLEQDLAIVSPLPQTTRDALLGVLTRGDAQLAFLDTPGLHQPKSELGRRMNLAAEEAARGADVIVVVTDMGQRERGASKNGRVDAEDERLIAALPRGVPALLALNKVDTLRDKARLLPRLQALGALHDFRAVIPISALNHDGVDRVLDELCAALPEGEAGYPEDTLTDRPTNYFVREYVREQILNATRGEVPHAVAISVDSYEPGALVRIAATIHVEKVGQRKILIGEHGSKIREIGTAARLRIAELVGQKVHLELFVRVTPRWKHMPRQLNELGYPPVKSEAANNDGSSASGRSR